MWSYKVVAINNPSVKTRSFAGRKAFDILVGRIPCGGDPVLIGYAMHRKLEEVDRKLDMLLQKVKEEKEEELVILPEH